jgi:hypothetical protein
LACRPDFTVCNVGFFTSDSNEIPATRLRYCYEKQIIKSTGSVEIRDLMMQGVTINAALLMRTR